MDMSPLNFPLNRRLYMPQALSVRCEERISSHLLEIKFQAFKCPANLRISVLTPLNFRRILTLNMVWDLATFLTSST